ncbi:MAG: type II toxin-antitoxin system antitoxin SocA domain-containing protein [Cyclonatronaceae bacterium]
MNSPFTGGETELIREPIKLEFRKETFEIIHHSRKCMDTNEFFTTSELDEININQVHNKYREKHHIPFPDQIRELREKYELSATRMSEILGFGINTYRNYENGEVPQASNGKLIRLAANPEEFRRLVEMSDVFSDKDLKKVLEKIDLMIEQQRDSDENPLKQLLSYKFQAPNVYNGYRDLKLSKFCNMIIYFADMLEPFKTKMNKLLFYADFLHYKKTGFSISGSNYRAIELGPVPNGYDTLFEYYNRNKFFDIKYIDFKGRDNIGEKFVSLPNKPFESELFTNTELECMRIVADHFKDASSDDIIESSHKEKAWEMKEKGKGMIEYDYAFELSID